MAKNRNVGLIAGYGAFPLELAEAMRQEGIHLHVIAVREEADPRIERWASSMVWLHVGQLGSMIRNLKKADVGQVVFAGKVRKLHLFRNFKPDFKAMQLLARMKDLKDDTIMLAIVECLNKEGIEVLSQLTYAGHMLVSQGHIAGPKPSQGMLEDAKFGYRQAKGIAALDIGQTVVVQNRAVLAVEAIEGTDETIRRGGRLGSGKAVVVKVAKPNQDERFDVPAVGPDTLTAMMESDCRLLAMEAGRTLMLQREALMKMAEDHGITLYGLPPCT